MGIIFRSIKLNILSLLAIPCLLAAFVCKLVAKVVEKLETLITMGLFTGLVIFGLWFWENLQNTKEILSSLLKIGGAVMGLGFIIFIIKCAISLIKAVFVIVKNAIMLVFDTVYGLFYSMFMDLYKSAGRDYERIRLELGPVIAFLTSWCYNLLRLINFLIIAFINIALVVFVFLSVAVPLVFLARYDLYLTKTEGYGLKEYLTLLQGFDRVSLIVVFVIGVLDLFVVLVSLGLAWKNWANELSFDTEDEERYREEIEENQEDFSKNISFLEADDKKSRHYLALLSDHIADVDDFMEEIRGALEIEDNNLLEDECSQYFKELSIVMREISDSDGELSPEEFADYIPRIKKLQRKKDNIEKLVDKQNELLDRPDLSTMFFSGCDTPEKLEKRYKALCRTYHPDVEGGDEDMFIAINEEYERLKG